MPLVPWVTAVIVSVSPASGSLSLASTSTITEPASATVALSSTATGGSFAIAGMSMAYTSLPARPYRLPSKYRAGSKLPDVSAPYVAGVNTNTSSLAPDTPLAAKLPLVERWNLPPATATPSMSSLLPSRPTSLPSKYSAHAPLVNPTSLPSKNISNVPSVFAPRLVAVNFTMSKSSTDSRVLPPYGAGMYPTSANDIRISVSLSTANASSVKPPSGPLRPTSEPSMYIVKTPSWEARMSSLAALTPPTVPSL